MRYTTTNKHKPTQAPPTNKSQPPQPQTHTAPPTKLNHKPTPTTSLNHKPTPTTNPHSISNITQQRGKVVLMKDNNKGSNHINQECSDTGYTNTARLTYYILCLILSGLMAFACIMGNIAINGVSIDNQVYIDTNSLYENLSNQSE